MKSCTTTSPASCWTPPIRSPAASRPENKDGKEESAETIIAWTNLYNDKARVFGTTLGHNNETCADARYLDLVTRGLLWSVDKLDDAHLKTPKSK